MVSIRWRTGGSQCRLWLFGCAMLLAGIGIYGVMPFGGQRKRRLEFASPLVRIAAPHALGVKAGQHDCSGRSIGCSDFALTRLMRGLLFGVALPTRSTCRWQALARCAVGFYIPAPAHTKVSRCSLKRVRIANSDAN